jgi:hypothetical protein
MDSSAPKEPSPFEKFAAVAKQVVSVPKAEMEKREKAWQKQRAKVKARKP